MYLRILSWVLIGFFIFSGHTQAEIYKWVDENGVVQFSDKPPAQRNGNQGVTSVDIPRHAPSDSGDTEKQEGNISFGVSDKAKAMFQSAPKVELFTTSWCPYCEKARKYLGSRGIRYTEYDIEKDQVAARRKRELGSTKGVPFAVINGKKVQGFSEQAYARALDGK